MALVLSPSADAGVRPDPDPQRQLTLDSDGVLRHLWESRYGSVLIEVKEGQVFVNGQRVERAGA